MNLLDDSQHLVDDTWSESVIHPLLDISAPKMVLEELGPAEGTFDDPDTKEIAELLNQVQEICKDDEEEVDDLLDAVKAAIDKETTAIQFKNKIANSISIEKPEIKPAKKSALAYNIPKIEYETMVLEEDTMMEVISVNFRVKYWE
ncbi:hypothetical protein HDV01_000025 [Terramyces sp. JEL0728]|nr:hypothetical protein HDV01_000025 [Terramyces sp. JEL0728]